MIEKITKRRKSSLSAGRRNDACDDHSSLLFVSRYVIIRTLVLKYICRLLIICSILNAQTRVTELKKKNETKQKRLHIYSTVLVFN